ncbi:MAG: O-succinylhomoserine sulfhydrylase [Pseudomonadota bacterium]
MNTFDWSEYQDQTIAVRAGHERTAFREHSEPVFMTSSFVFDSAEQAAACFAGEEDACIYSRFTNPTVSTFEQRLAAMEGGEACVATASGMSAILATCLGLLEQGDEIVASRSVFGSTSVLFNQFLPRYGITVHSVSQTELSEWEAAITPRTKLLFLETPSNPLTEVADIQALAGLAHLHGCWLAVDNCFCTPALQKPLDHGADIVIHSATKYLDGQGRALGGAVVGDRETVGEKIYSFLRTGGPAMSPFNAWVFLKGLETLSLRMKAHSENAQALAEWLEQQSAVERVYYPGLPSHPQHKLASHQQTGYGGIVSFVLKGGQAAAWELMNQTELLSITANLGDTKSTITHPGSTTHGRLSEEERALSGVKDGLVRIAVGLEDIEDIKGDLKFSPAPS